MGHDLPMLTAKEITTVLEGLGFRVAFCRRVRSGSSD